ncbi:3,4-dihydroxy-2-butanone-4-phosphate synthase [Catellatospora sp. KI3]|uniref:3,4-dihydroxy-2-butanone-4-phosphate synthase n=1 Tax=Catellatospora sp. KI3 TaxID=3041620 RepID=UPI002482CD27|nr:3,4-dihydroxy-2-butanone-4-phosphate synthase [Catellatospora sp. KI3]MDI1466181.1 3,4-dihydroxy-2-butanone-4-phosphate synthase [Catellatospora sp. KI3]
MSHAVLDPAAATGSAVDRALEVFAQGGFVLVFDRESRENEGDLMIAAEHLDEAALRFMLDHTAGVVCVAVTPEIADRLNLHPMVEPNTGLHDTAFTVSVDLAAGTTTGISVGDRTLTIRALADATTRPQDLARPGHVFPIRAVEGGVLARDGHTEAGVDLSLLCGLSGATAICEVVRPDWSMARLDDLVALAERFELPMISVQDLIDHRRRA